jgi:hypothetical protein
LLPVKKRLPRDQDHPYVGAGPTPNLERAVSERTDRCESSTLTQPCRRAGASVSQVALAEQTGVAVSTITRIEKG